MKYYVVDAFTDRLFSGNPAGVCLLEREIPEDVMQSIAFENNLAETAFLLKKDGKYHLRWFTPEVEIDLCGHATLATAFVVMNFVAPKVTDISFETKSGVLSVAREGDTYTMNFPSRAPKLIEKLPQLEQALGCKVLETHLSRDLLVLVPAESDVASLRPDIPLLARITKEVSFAVIVTAKGENCDFVSRFFAPSAGILEDPVTGSSHSTLIPFWSGSAGQDQDGRKAAFPTGRRADMRGFGRAGEDRAERRSVT